MSTRGLHLVLVIIASLLACGHDGAARAETPAGEAAGDGTGAAPKAAPADAIYVDPQITAESSTTYDPAARKGEGGTQTAYRTLQGAAKAAQPGQTVLIRAGTYGETLVPANSGLADRPITYRSYPGEEAVITGPKLEPGVNISNRSYLVIEGLKIANVERWMYALKAHHNVIRNNHFFQAVDAGRSSKTGLFFQEATFNQVVGNTLEECNEDSLALVRSDRNLIEKNTFKKAKHTLWAIKGGNFNIIRGNYFHNEWQKIGEVYDCEDVGFDHEFNLVNCTKHNLIEGNVFAYAPSSGNHSPFSGIQYAAQNGIVRRNVFYEIVGPALDMEQYAKEAMFTTDNRVYNNVFYKTDFAGILLAGGGKGRSFSHNILKNNILLRSIFVANDKRWGWYTKKLAGQPVQLMVANLHGFAFENNCLFNKQEGEGYLITAGSRMSSTNLPPHNVPWWQEKYPALFKASIEADPAFVDEAKHDFHLKPASPMIDTGAFLTATEGAGSGTTMPVQDVGYFCDGFGIPAQEGDLIQLDGQTQTARVTAIDYDKSTLTLSQPLTWTDGQGVSLSYSGKRPDLGAFEYQPAPGR